jgi:hypothetical protein
LVDFVTHLEWYGINVLEVFDTTIAFQTIIHFENGTETKSQWTVDINNGSGNGTYLIAFIAAVLNPSETLCNFPPQFTWCGWQIQETISRPYVGVMRETNHLNVTNWSFIGRYPPLEFNAVDDFYWDRATGIICEDSHQQSFEREGYVTSLSLMMKIVDTNLWETPVVSVYTFSIIWGEETFIVSVESNSTISNFAFNQSKKEINFYVTGEASTIGFCNVTIPKALLYAELGDWILLMDDALATHTITENETHSSLYSTYTHTTHKIRIIGTWVIGPPPDMTPPLIATIFQEPPADNVVSNQIVAVFVDVTDAESGVKNVILAYSIDNGVTWTNLTMLYNTTIGLYVGVIPGFLSGTTVSYKIIAYDYSDNVVDTEYDLGYYFIYMVTPPPLSVSIGPLSASILVGQPVTFTSTVSGGYTPYSYQWYLNGAPVSGATSNTWTFTPTTSGIYYIYLKVTDAKANTAQSEAARIVVATVPVGGYSFPIQVHTKTEPVLPYIALVAILTAIFTKLRPKTKRKR